MTMTIDPSELNNKIPRKHFMTRAELLCGMFDNSSIVDKNISQNWAKVKLNSGEMYTVWTNKIEKS